MIVVRPHLVPVVCGLLRIIPAFNVIDKYFRCEAILYGVTDWLFGDQNKVKQIR